MSVMQININDGDITNTKPETKEDKKPASKPPASNAPALTKSTMPSAKKGYGNLFGN